MGYDVAIVDAPIAPDERAWQDLDKLFDERDAAPFDASPKPITPTLQRLYETFVERYPCLQSIPDDQLDNTESPWKSAPLRIEFSGRLAHIGLVSSRAEPALPFLIAAAHRLGLPFFDLTANQLHRPGGFAGLVLEGDGLKPLIAPRLEDIVSLVDRMTPKGGPGFLVLSGPGQNYLQSAGGDGAYICEWREYQGQTFRHWAAGHLDQDAAGTVRIPTNGFHVEARGNERLSSAEVKTLLAAFAQGSQRPSTFAWRDMTDQF